MKYTLMMLTIIHKYC